MVNSNTVSKIAKYVGIVAIVFAAILAVITYLLLQIATIGAPAEYVLFEVLTVMWPYLFVAVAAFVVAIFAKGNGQQVEAEEAEALPPETQPTQTSA